LRDSYEAVLGQLEVSEDGAGGEEVDSEGVVSEGDRGVIDHKGSQTAV